MKNLFETNTIIASAGLVLATMSFISGLQVVKRDNIFGAMAATLHRFNGYLSCLAYVILATMSLSSPGGTRMWPVIGWITGVVLIVGKVMCVRNPKLYKYGSRLGLLLFIAWLFIIYKHIIT